MRLSTAAFHRSSIDSILEQQTRLARTQTQVTSGKRFQSAAEDPIAATRAAALERTVADNEQFVERLKKVAVMQPQPEVHIRGDYEARYQAVGRVVFGAQRAGIRKLGFITEPPPSGGR